MRAPISWLRSLVALPPEATTAAIADRLTRVGLQVEHIDQLGANILGPVVVGRVRSFTAEPQTNGKTIRWCSVDVGEPEPRGIVCGAANFEAGDYVVVALPGAILPGSFAISARTTYGHVSDGMMCAWDELGLGEDHTGIIVLNPLEAAAAGLGSDARTLLQARDEVLDIDVTPDMGYCLSIRGLARETAQAFAVPYTDRYLRPTPAPRQAGHPVHLESPDCPLFVALQVDEVHPQAPTPTWMVHRLQAAGMRPISLPVDITNYVMLESGQPLHAYDADLLQGPIVVRHARPGEQLTTLDGVERELSASDLLITDDSGPIGLAGVMGGRTTEVSAATTSILLEAAHFDPAVIGRSYRRHKLPSEASRRFERNVDPALPYAAAHEAARLLVELAGGRLQTAETVAGAVPPPPHQRIAVDLPARVLGAPVSAEQVRAILLAAGVTVIPDGDELELVAPSWRPDLADPYDYVEEVGRQFGLDAIPPRVPRAAVGRGLTFDQRGRREVIRAVAQVGFVELITLPFIGQADLDRMQLPADDQRRAVVRLANPLSDTQPYLRTTLLPGLFAAVLRNTSRSQDDLALFECGQVTIGGPRHPAPLPDVSSRPSPEQIAELYNSLPAQPRMLAGVLTGDWTPKGWQGPAVPADWRHAVYLAQTAAEALGVQLIRKAAEVAPWHPGRCAQLTVRTADGRTRIIGAAGELHPGVVRAFGLPERTCAVELNLDDLLSVAPTGGEVRTLSAFPLAKEDVALVVDADVPAADVEAALRAGAGDLLESVSLFDVYTGPQVGEGKKSLAYRLNFRGLDRTLTQAEAGAARDAAVARAAALTGAVQRAW